MAGRKWPTGLLIASIGSRIGCVRVIPSDEVLIMMSLDEQPARKRQSGQTTYTSPVASMDDIDRARLRKLPATRRSLIDEMRTVELQVEPPSVEVKAIIRSPLSSEAGIITVPFDCTTGTPPIPVALSPVVAAGLQFSPPSADVLTHIRPFMLGSSHVI